MTNKYCFHVHCCDGDLMSTTVRAPYDEVGYDLIYKGQFLEDYADSMWQNANLSGEGYSSEYYLSAPHLVDHIYPNGDMVFHLQAVVFQVREVIIEADSEEDARSKMRSDNFLYSEEWLNGEVVERDYRLNYGKEPVWFESYYLPAPELEWDTEEA